MTLSRETKDQLRKQAEICAESWRRTGLRIAFVFFLTMLMTGITISLVVWATLDHDVVGILIDAALLLILCILLDRQKMLWERALERVNYWKRQMSTYD